MYFKCTKARATSVHNFHDVSGNTQWDKPVILSDGKWKAGNWKPEVKGDLRMHFAGVGYHLSTMDFLIKWLGDEIYLAEPSDDKIETLDCAVSRSARLLRPYSLQPSEWGQFAIEQSRLALELFKIFNYTWDVNHRLKNAIEQAAVQLSRSHCHPGFQELNRDEQRIWIEAQAVVDLCDRDSLSGFLTQANTRGAYCASKAILELKGLSYPYYPIQTNPNSKVVKNITSYLAEAIKCIVENPILKQGKKFDRSKMHTVAQDYTDEAHPHFDSLPDLAAYNMTVQQNRRLLRKLGIDSVAQRTSPMIARVS
jgi:hypothetical protein